MITKVVIPAAGLGTRFRPATTTIPKELIPVLNVPALDYIAAEAMNSGMSELIIINSARKIMLREWISKFNNHHKAKNIWAIEVIQEAPLGLGHAILQAKDIVKDEPFAVMLPDDITFATPPVLQQMIQLYDNLQGSILCVKNIPSSLVESYGVIEHDNSNKVIGIVEKPKPEDAPSNLCAIGRYILQPEIFQYLSDAHPSINNEIQLTDSINNMLKQNTCYKYHIEGHHFDIGTPKGLISACLFASQNPKLLPSTD